MSRNLFVCVVAVLFLFQTTTSCAGGASQKSNQLQADGQACHGQPARFVITSHNGGQCGGGQIAWFTNSSHICTISGSMEMQNGPSGRVTQHFEVGPDGQTQP